MVIVIVVYNEWLLYAILCLAWCSKACFWLIIMTFQLGALWPKMEAKCLETRSKSHGCYIWLIMVINNCSQCASASNPYPIWLVMVGDAMVPMVGDSAVNLLASSYESAKEHLQKHQKKGTKMCHSDPLETNWEFQWFDPPEIKPEITWKITSGL